MPLTILAVASGALKAIQQGCEVYKEFKDVVAEAKKTYDEVAGEVQEVIGVWGFLKSKFFGPPKSPNKPETVDTPKPTPKPKKVKQHQFESEIDVTKNLLENLKIFFDCLTALQLKVKEAEEASLDESKDMLGSALDIEYALSEVEKMQKQIRETMVYNSPKELGDLYTRVVKRVGLIKEQQFLARREAAIKAREEQWQREHRAQEVTDNLVITVVALILLAETWAILIAIRQASS